MDQIVFDVWMIPTDLRNVLQERYLPKDDEGKVNQKGSMTSKILKDSLKDIAMNIFLREVELLS